MDKKNIVIDSFLRHELGKELVMTNSEYDKLLDEVKAEDPSFDPFQYLPISADAETAEHRALINAIEKYSPQDNDISIYWFTEEGKLKTPKYDGSSLCIYYTNGKFSHILTMGNKEVGVVQTEKFYEFVPKSVDPSISVIRCECLVDFRHYENARGKANGLVNSKYLQDEVNSLCTLVGFEIIDINNKEVYINDERAIAIKPIRNNEGRFIFFISPEIAEITLLNRGYGRIEKYDFNFCLDGIVYSKDKDWNAKWCYKYDYLTTAITTINEVVWSETSREGWSAVLSIDPVELDNKNMYNVSANGVPNLLSMGLGEGSKIEVAFSGMTIPKVVKVIEPVNAELPKCPYCGYQMTEGDIIGSVVKCSNPDCNHKYELRKEWLTNSLADEDKGDKTDSEYVVEWLEYYIFYLANISRYNSDKNCHVEFSEIKDQLLATIKCKDYDKFFNIIYNSYYMTSNAEWEFDLIHKALLNVLNEFIYAENKINE